MENGSTEPLRILIADDEPLVTSSLREVLSAKGYVCVVVETGKDAMDRLREQPFDLLIADLHMPGNPRLELIYFAATRKPHVPTIILTGHPTVETAVEALRVGVADYISKPWRFDEFLLRVERAIELGRAKRETEQLDLEFEEMAAQLSEDGSYPVLGPILRARLGLGEESTPKFFSTTNLPPEELALLTARERELVSYLAGGERLFQVAQRLDISVHTARNHLRSVFRKLGVHSQLELLEKLRGAPPPGT